MIRTARAIALIAYGALILLIIVGGALPAPASAASPVIGLVFKLAPLVLFFYPLIRGRPKSYLYAALVTLIYFIDGVVVSVGAALTPHPVGIRVAYGTLEALLALAFFVSAVLYARFTSAVSSSSRTNGTVTRR